MFAVRLSLREASLGAGSADRFVFKSLTTTRFMEVAPSTCAWAVAKGMSSSLLCYFRQGPQALLGNAYQEAAPCETLAGCGRFEVLCMLSTGEGKSWFLMPEDDEAQDD